MTTPATHLEIRDISAAETRSMRGRILRPGAAPTELEFPGDDDPLTLHVGAYLDGEQVGITSVYEERRPDAPHDTRGEWRLRGVATDASVRRTGVASRIMDRCLEHIAAHDGHLVWCNARTPAVDFYRAHGFSILGEEFHIPGAGPHYFAERDLREPGPGRD